MEPVIIRIAESVEIAAPPSAVFALVSDPLAKARLNPFVQVIRIEREDPGPLCEGRITFLRLQKGTRIFEYRTRCRALEPDRWGSRLWLERCGQVGWEIDTQVGDPPEVMIRGSQRPHPLALKHGHDQRVIRE